MTKNRQVINKRLSLKEQRFGTGLFHIQVVPRLLTYVVKLLKIDITYYYLFYGENTLIKTIN